ncbi:MAG: leucine-rich repeat protein, partial [Clostridia bacterium]|nr:leucine-rich repeat protein [Clostridia bacterium]
MKKFLSVLLSIIMILSVCPLTALADEVVTAYESNAAESETDSTTEPDPIDLGKNVSASGSNDYCTWSYDSETKTMTVNGKLIKGMSDGEYPNALPTYTVDENGDKSFAYFGFENLIFGSNVTEFDSVYINESYYPNLKYVSLENTKVTAISEKLFECCNATEIKLPEKLEAIGDEAFHSSFVENVVIPSKVTHIGYSAFAESAVATVSFGNINATVDDYVFKNCTYLTSVDMQNAVLTSADDTPMVPKGIFMGCTKLTDVKLNDNIKTVGSSAFNGCSSLESVSIPNADVIQFNAFKDCTNLSELNRNPSKAITIGQYAFSGTKSLQNEDFDNIVGLGQYAFQYSAVQNCTVYSYGTEDKAGQNAFYYAKNLKNVTVKNNYISNYMFQGAVVDTVNFVSSTNDKPRFYTYSFSNATVSNINMDFPEESTITIGSYAFSGAKYIGSKPLKFESEGSVSIGTGAFKKFDGEVDFSDCYISKISRDAFRESTISKFEAQVGDKVDNYAFSDCGNLISFVNNEYRDGTAYGDYVFNNCQKLTKFYSDALEGDVESSIGKYTFYNCPALSDVKISKVTEIGMHAFENCKSLVSLSFPNLQVFENSAFMNCTSLQTIDIGHAFEVPCYAFKACSSLVTVKHSGDVESVEAEAFYCCQELVNFNTDTVFYIEKNAFNGCENFVPKSLKRVKTIGANAFESCEAITTLQFSDFLTSIDDEAFLECTKLTDVTFSPTSIKFGENIFGNCLSLKNLTFRGYNYEMPSTFGFGSFSNITFYCGQGSSPKIFADSHGIKVVDIQPEEAIGGDNRGKLDNGRWVVDNGVLKIYGLGSGELGPVFMLADDTEYETDKLIQHYNVKSVEFLGNITSIPDNFFSGCRFDELAKLELPESIKSIGANAFKGVKSTNGFEVVMPADIASIGDYAFANSSVLGFDFSLCQNEYTLGEGVFSGNQKLTSIDINTPEIPQKTFYNDTALTSVTLHNQTSIGDYAFNNSSITEISIPASVKKIGAGVFTNCLKLMTVTVNSIDTEFNFASIISPENSMGYRSDGSRIYGFKIKADPRSKAHSYAVKALLDYESIKIAYKSTGYVSKFKGTNDYARWYYYPDDNTLLITDKSIAGGTFYDENYEPVQFNNIDTVRFFDDVSIIEPGWKAINPKNVYISEMTKQISDKAFADCTNLQAINIPDSVTQLGEYAFDNCSGLKSVTIGKGVQNISAFAFRECIKLQELNILGAVTIGRAAFKDCSKLVTLNLPDTLQTIRTTAFINCYSLIRINFGKNLRTIDSYAFANLPFCDEININSNITNVSQNAFCNTGIS